MTAEAPGRNCPRAYRAGRGGSLPIRRRGRMSKSRLVLLFVIAAAIAAFFAFDLGRYFSLDYFKSQQAAIDACYQAHPWQTARDLLSRSTSR